MSPDVTLPPSLLSSLLSSHFSSSTPRLHLPSITSSFLVAEVENWMMLAEEDGQADMLPVVTL